MCGNIELRFMVSMIIVCWCNFSIDIYIIRLCFISTVIPSPPEEIVITFSNSDPPSFTVSWSPPSSTVVGGIGGYMFGVTGNCGDCMDMTVSADTLSVTCSGWTANDQTCTFEVRTLTQDCEFTSDASSITLSGVF